MKKLLSLMLLLIAVAMAGCFNQDKEKQEEKAVEQETAKTKSSPYYTGVRIFLEQENKYYDLEAMTMISMTIMGKYVTPTVDTKVTMYTLQTNFFTGEKVGGVTLGTAKLLKGKKYLVYCDSRWQGGCGEMEAIDLDSRFVVNEKNEMFKMSFGEDSSGCKSWNATNVQGSSFKIMDTQNNRYYFDGMEFTTAMSKGVDVAINPNKYYDIVILQEALSARGYIYINEKDIEQYKVIGSISAKDYIGYYDFYSGMKVKLISEKNETFEAPVVWNTRSNTFDISANGLKYGTYKIKSTYQAIRNGNFYGSSYGENDKVLVEYNIDTNITIDSKSLFYPLQEGGKGVNIGSLGVTYKVVKNLSKNFNTLAICGAHNNWNTKGNLTFKGNNTWEGDIELGTLDNSVLFIADSNWNVKYGDINKDNIGDLNKGDIKIAYAGKYHVIFNDSTLKYSINLIEKKDIGKNFNEIAVSGQFNNWNTKGNMTFVGNHQWKYEIVATANIQFIFIGNKSWDSAYGDKNKDGIAEKGTNTIYVQNGTYQILFNDSTLKYSIVKIKK